MFSLKGWGRKGKEGKGYQSSCLEDLTREGERDQRGPNPPQNLQKLFPPKAGGKQGEGSPLPFCH